MRATPLTGLVQAGGVNRSFVARMPVLLGGLGPVKAASFRVARRIVNSLRAGFAVTDYSELDSCGLIWLDVPDEMLDRVIEEMVAKVFLDGKMVVLCGSARDSLSPGPLRGGRARVASFTVAEESGDRVFIGEGHPEVMRELHRLAAAEKRKLIELRPGTKALYYSGVHLAAQLVLPWIAAAVESLRAAGFSRVEATRAVEAIGTRALHGYTRAGRKAWKPGAAPELRRALACDIGAIRSVNPRLAALYADGIEQALGYFEHK